MPGPPTTPSRRCRRGHALPLALASAFAFTALGAAPAGAADFAPITDAERALAAAPGDPEAPAVVLFERGRMDLLDFRKDMYSELAVEVRIKILAERGAEMYGDVEIEHSRGLRLSGFQGRTVLPDGRVIPVDEDSIFVDTTSRARKRYATKAAFPAVEPGAILDYRYSLRWDGFLTFEPWYFGNLVPTLRSEITYVVPLGLGAEPRGREIGGVKLNAESGGRANQREVKVWAENIPAIPDEPSSPPLTDLASYIMLLPTEFITGSSATPLLKSWDSVCEIAHYGYGEMRNNKGATRRLAGELTAAAASPRARTEALHRFVRDEIQHDGALGVFALGDDETIDRVVKDRRGGAAEKAVVLEEMLDAAGLAPRLVWAGDRQQGRIDPEIVNPVWFERVLVMVELDGGRVFLDPVDRHLGFGQLAPGFEGTPALLYHRRKPEVIELPATPTGDNLRRAEVGLAVDAEGRVTGGGSLTLGGHHAWLDRAGRAQEDREPDDVWRRRLEEWYGDYRVTDVAVSDAVDERRITVTWKLTLRDEEVLGDEVALSPSRPIGPQSGRFALPAARRITPVLLPFADVEEVALTVSWPEGWEVESAPEDLAKSNPAGAFEQNVELDGAARTLSYRRRVELRRSEFQPGAQYAALRALTAAVEKADAQPLVLAAR